MTTPTNPTPQERAEQFREEIRSLLDALDTKLEDLRAQVEQNTVEINGLIDEIHAMREGLKTASQPAPAGSSFAQMMIDTIIMTYNDEGEPAYKALGAPYQKFGVRIWPEVVTALGIKAGDLKPGKNPITPALPARVLMATNDEGKTNPRKVTGKA